MALEIHPATERLIIYSPHHIKNIWLYQKMLSMVLSLLHPPIHSLTHLYADVLFSDYSLTLYHWL